MTETLPILQKQIAAQIESRIDIKVYFKELKNEVITYDDITLYDQRNHAQDRSCYIRPVFAANKKIDIALFDKLLSLVDESGNIHSTQSYNDFYNVYYNNI
jgi:hypothetical protein